MGKIYSRSEYPDSELRKQLMAVPVVNIKQSTSGCLNGYTQQTTASLKNNVEEVASQENEYKTFCFPIEVRTNEPAGQDLKDSRMTPEEHSKEEDSLAGGIPSDNWWTDLTPSWSEDYQYCETDQSEDINYCLDSDHTECSCAGGRATCVCYNRKCNATTSSYLKDGNAPHFAGLKPSSEEASHVQKEDKISNTCVTDEKIRNLKALLAEQEKAIQKLKNLGKGIALESKNVDHSTSLRDTYHCNPLSELSECAPSCEGSYYDCYRTTHHKLIRVFEDEEHKTTNRKRRGSDISTLRDKHAVGLSNTKRFRYYLRKDVPQGLKTHLSCKTTDDYPGASPRASDCYAKADIRRDSFNQEEFLSFFGLIRSNCVTQK